MNIPQHYIHIVAVYLAYPGIAGNLVAMREILYVQAGNLANYVGTHFWNTQESYFAYSDDDEPLVNHDISFREGLTRKVSSHYNSIAGVPCSSFESQ